MSSTLSNSEQRFAQCHAPPDTPRCICAIGSVTAVLPHVQGTTISLSSRIASLAIDHASQDDHASLDDHKGGSICGSTHSAHYVSMHPSTGL